MFPEQQWNRESISRRVFAEIDFTLFQFQDFGNLIVQRQAAQTLGLSGGQFPFADPIIQGGQKACVP